MALFAFAANAQTAGSVTMGPSYANQVYYKMSNQATNAYAHSSWDIAFYRMSSMALGIRVNEAKGILTYEVGPLSTWETVDVSQEASWTPLYNSETVWPTGSFDNGSAGYGFGEYNSVTHHVVGSVVFALKFADGSFRKIKIDDYYGGYTFTHSSWDGTAWTADVTANVPNSTTTNRFFNYYSFASNATVLAEPESTEWDFVFTKYNTDIMGDGSLMYPVTGALHHPDIQVAENTEPDGMPSNPALTYSASINTIGYDWKSFSGTAYTVNSDKAFYVKYANNTVYRLVFNTFEGSATGVITFNFEDVTALLDSEQFENKVSFGVYPNPSANKKISVVYEAPASNTDKNSVSIFNLNGSKVYEAQLDNTGFANSELNLSNLNDGVYILKFESGDYSATKKIVLQ